MPVTPHLAIIVDLDKLPAAYDTHPQVAGMTAFVLTISAGLVKPSGDPLAATLPPRVLPEATTWADLSRWFLPWNWFPSLGTNDRRYIPRVKIWHKPSGGAFALLPNVGDPDGAWPVWDLYHHAAAPLQTEPDLKDDSEAARVHYDACWKTRIHDDTTPWSELKEEMVAWRIPVKTPVDANDEPLVDETNLFQLPAQTAKVGTSCFPQNHAHGLACCVVVNVVPAKDDEFFALPVWPEAWGAPHNMLVGPDSDPDADPLITQRGTYNAPNAGWALPHDTAGTPLGIFGYSRVWKAGINGTPPPFLDLTNMVVKLQKPWSADWLVHLENETAALFDLSQRLVDAARDYLDGCQPALLSVADLAALPTSGRKLVIVAKVAAEVHLRIFDFGGNQIDKPENQLPPGDDLENLRTLLNSTPLPDIEAMTRAQRQEVVGRALRLAGIQPIKAKPIAQWLVLASRELADFGTHVSSAGSVLALTPREMKAMLTTAQVAAVNEYAGTFAKSAKTWLAEIDEIASKDGINYRPGSLNIPELNPDNLPVFTGRSFRDFAAMLFDLKDDAPLTHEHVSLWERFVSDMRDADTIRDLVLHQWRWVTVTAPFENDPKELKAGQFIGKLRLRLNDSLNPFRQMARGLLAKDKGKYWAAIVKTGSDSTGGSIQVNVCNQFEQYQKDFAQRFATVDPLPALDADFLKCLAHVVATEASRLAPKESGEQLRPRERPQGVTLEFDQPCHAEEMEQEADLLSRIAGVVTLVRDAAGVIGGGAWRSLSYAQLTLLREKAKVSDPKPGDLIPLKALYLVPNRPGYTSQKRETTITYDNHPLAAESPAAALFAGSAEKLPTGYDDEDADHGRVLNLSVPPTADDDILDEVRLVGLAYGREMIFATLPVLNTGVLHPKLSAGHPCLPRKVTANTAADDFHFGLPDGTIFDPTSKAGYRRMVGVSEPRMLSEPYECGKKLTISERDAKALSFPEIPRSVRPLAWEIVDDASQDFAPEAPLVRRPALLLLCDEGQTSTHKELKIDLRKPTTGLENWSRWHAINAAMNGRRAAEIAANAKQAEDQLDDPEDLSLDDPAVENFLWVEAECLFSSQTDSALPMKMARTTDWKVGGLLNDAERRASAAFTFSLKKEDEEAILKSDSLVIPRGSVWRVCFHPLVRKDWFDERFETGAFRTAAEAIKAGAPGDWQITSRDQVIDGTHYVVFRPWEMLVEGAIAKMPDPAVLWERLEAKATGDVVELSLVGDGTHAGDAPFAFISRVEVRQQTWNWTGWQTGAFPFSQQTPLDADEDAAFLWDAIGFHDRAPWQHASKGTTVLWRNERKTRQLATLFKQDHAGDPRALYHRFTAVAHSRYEGLWDSPVAARRALPSNVSDLWRRCLLRPRPLERLPRPSINIIVPLTRKYDPKNLGSPGIAENNTAGLLIVLRDRWYAQAGLAETLEMEIGIHQHWTKDGGPWEPPADYWAAGHDPIVSALALAGGKTALRQVFNRGPVGHTFDIGASSPLLAASSFVLDTLPAAILAEAPDLSWFMAQIRLRRVHAPGSLVSSDGTGTVDETWASEWTAPEWVQFLPDANRLLPQEWRERGSVAMMKGAGADQIKAAGWEEPDLGTIADKNLFDYWLLITRPVVDVRGQQQEQYVGIVGQTTGDTGTTFSKIDGELPTAPANQSAPFFVRVMELRLARRHEPVVAKVREQFRDDIAKIPVHPAPHGRHRLDFIFGFKEDKSRVFEDSRAQITALSDRLDVQFTN